MRASADLEKLINTLEDAERRLRKAALNNPALKPAVRALGRLASRVRRPLRIAILGEANSGKSSLLNAMLGERAMPTLARANTRIPTLFRYASNAGIEGMGHTGQRLPLASTDHLHPDAIFRIEVGLPADRLRFYELLDFPGNANPLFRVDLADVASHGVDLAIWTTAATQAWRETERVAWASLPPRIRRRGVLVVTYSDLIASDEDLGKIRSRLISVAQTHFVGLCFVAAATVSPDAGFTGASELFAMLGDLKNEFYRERNVKAVLITRRLAARALTLLEPTPI